VSIHTSGTTSTRLARAVFLALLVAGCRPGTDATDAQPEPAVPTEQPAAALVKPAGTLQVGAGELAAQPQSYLGRRVLVRGPATDVYNALLFTLDEDPARPGPDVLVVLPRPASIALPGETVTVEGTVRPFVREELESDFAGFELAPELEILVQERPVVVAESVLTADGTDVVAEPEAD
jgi:hypothetical protein